MKSDKFDLKKYLEEHKLTSVEALRRKGYEGEADFLTELVSRSLNQDELYQLLIENKMAFGAQKPFAKDVNLPLSKRLRGMVGTLGRILKNDLFTDEIKEVARRELKSVKRLQEEIGPIVVDLGTPAKEKDFINPKISQLADYLENCTDTGDTLADEHRLIAALFNTYNISDGEWTGRLSAMFSAGLTALLYPHHIVARL